ncbi:hypothetical protein FJR48_05735 [Sulfurimonas lithotrophica]|uniref:Campylobacter invasion antigen D C-terminal domain-containing protein n=1 Tax=Sulfurimonas lithotrophica TaxID=2590022 RepID=A0A5P8P0L0_9BACT|nr:hypothetical protein [Sulfurimonas lithotrophica]QFR49256.1 hypothetical protein FJR48_05735 [Sulfurimonas lithotrophica]
MELEDAILSTLKEIEDKGKSKLLQPKKKPFEVKEKKEISTEEDICNHKDNSEDSSMDEKAYLMSMRERLLVLFEGFQAPNNTNIEAKIDLTLNYLEYVLASIDTRLEKLR